MADQSKEPLNHPELDDAAHTLDKFRIKLNKASELDGTMVPLSITKEEATKLKKAILLALTGMIYMDVFSGKMEDDKK